MRESKVYSMASFQLPSSWILDIVRKESFLLPLHSVHQTCVPFVPAVPRKRSYALINWRRRYQLLTACFRTICFSTPLPLCALHLLLHYRLVNPVSWALQNLHNDCILIRTYDRPPNILTPCRLYHNQVCNGAAIKFCAHVCTVATTFEM